MTADIGDRHLEPDRRVEYPRPVQMQTEPAFIHQRTRATFLIFGVLILIALTGIPRLTVENRFIDYFKDETEIFQGMTLIDEKLGGTTPMDVIIDAPADEIFEDDEYEDDSDISEKPEAWQKQVRPLE